MKLPAPAIWLFTLLGGFALAVTVLGQWFGLRDVYADGRPLGIVERYENTVLRREQFYDEENDSATVSVSLRLPEKAVVQTPPCRADDASCLVDVEPPQWKVLPCTGYYDTPLCRYNAERPSEEILPLRYAELYRVTNHESVLTKIAYDDNGSETVLQFAEWQAYAEWSVKRGILILKRMVGILVLVGVCWVILSILLLKPQRSTST